MRIVIVGAPFAPCPPAPSGAVNKIWCGLSSVFAERGHEVTILCRKHETQESDEILHGVRYMRRTQLRRTNNITLDLIKDLFYAARMTSLLPKSDICVTNSFWLPILASRFRKNIGKIVVAAHRYPKGQMWLYSRCDRLAPPSKAVGVAIAHQTPKVAHLLKVISNPIDTHVFVPPTVIRSFTGTQTILYTGRINPEKGLHILMGAFLLLYSKFPNLKLRFIGPWKKEEGGGGLTYLNGLREKASGLPVEFPGGIANPRDLAQELQEAHYYCYPSVAAKGEACPVAPLEAMATGLVPVVSRIDQFRDYIEGGKTGYFFDHDSDRPDRALADTLARLITSRSTTEKMSVQAARKAAEFSYENIADAYLEDWKSLCSK